jgi:hypothetical protein
VFRFHVKTFIGFKEVDSKWGMGVYSIND